MSSQFATLLMWVNAVVIVIHTMMAYDEALKRNMKQVRQHLQLAGLIALFSALMCSVVLYERKVEASSPGTTKNASWNAYPTTSR